MEMTFSELVGLVVAIVAGISAVFFIVSSIRARQKDTNEITKTIQKIHDEIDSIEKKKAEYSKPNIESVKADDMLQNIGERLYNVENYIESLKERRQDITSAEYQLLMFEIDRVVRGLREDTLKKQERLELDLDRRMSNFRIIFTVSLAIISIIIAGFGIVIFLIG